MTRTNARHALFASFRKLIASGEKEFPQGNEKADKAGVDLFNTKLPVDQQHRVFHMLCSHAHWVPARAIMSEMMRHYVDVDGNFVEQFQTTAFDSRIWELYLYAALLELGLFVNKEHEAPDFEVHDGRSKVFIEAVIVGPAPNDPPLDPPKNGMPRMRTPEEIKELLKTRAPIRLGSALYSRLNRKTKYWDLEHVKGFPLVFRRFLGLASYCRRFVENFSKIAKPLSNLLQKGVKYGWSLECKLAFDTLKEKLTSSPVWFLRMIPSLTRSSATPLFRVLVQF